MCIRHDRGGRLGNGGESMKIDILKELEDFSETLMSFVKKLKAVKDHERKESMLRREYEDDLNYMKRMLDYGISDEIEQRNMWNELNNKSFGKSIRLASREASLHFNEPAPSNEAFEEGFHHTCRNKVSREEELIPHHMDGKEVQWLKYILDLADAKGDFHAFTEKARVYNERLYGDSLNGEGAFRPRGQTGNIMDIMRDMGISRNPAEYHSTRLHFSDFTRLDPFDFTSIPYGSPNLLENNA